MVVFIFIVSKYGICFCVFCYEDFVKLQVQYGRRLQYSDFDLYYYVLIVKIKDLRFIFC